MQSFLGLSSYYINHINNFAHITSSLYRLCSKDVVFEITKERKDEYERIKHELTNAPVVILPDFELPFRLHIDAACSQGLGAGLHQRQIVDGEPREGLICYISRKLKDSEARYGASQTECLCLVWDLEKLHYYLEGAVFEVYTDCTALKSLLKMKTTNGNMLRWQIAIQQYSGNMTIIYKEGKSHTNADGLRRRPLDNVKSNPAYDLEAAAKIPMHFMGIDRTKNFRLSEWAPEDGTLDSENIASESPELESQLEEPWFRAYKDNKFFLIDGLLYHREKHTSALTVVDRDHISLNAACSQGLGAALHQRQIVDGEPREGVIFYISRQLKDSEARYGPSQTECLCLVWALEKLHYYLEGAVFEAYTDCTALKSLLKMKTTNGNMLRWQIAIQKYSGNMTIIYKEGKSHTNADGVSRRPLDNVKSNPAYDPEAAAKIPIHLMEVDRKKNFRFSEWARESGTLDSGNTDSEGTETPTLGLSSSEQHNEFFSAVWKSYAKHKQCGILLQLLQQKYRSPELESQLEEPWLRAYKDNKFFLIDGLLYHRKKHTSALTVVDRDHISLILQECHDCPYMGCTSEDRTKERVASKAWWPKWEQ
ncbi:hypothetical protein O181_112928 [Austropuccinia psidii MF-1]|uniref:Reverse transcriptase RNase H-like domain-containing protein n=1 Tax=Austropuccinia psidii MF-1 TaxID=1389203 RepID=A0A9Q3PT53_9BASI|nr:hypothetical protein [Austropuccinia psidii MF-1]